MSETKVDEKQLAVWEALAKAATEGPWRIDAEGDVVGTGGDVLSGSGCEGDLAFIAAAREAVPALIEEVRCLSDRVETAQLLGGALQGERDAADERAFNARVDAETKLALAECGANPTSIIGKICHDLATWKAGCEHERAKRKELEALLKLLPEMNEGFTRLLRAAGDPSIVRNYVTTAIGYAGRSFEVTFQVPGGMTPVEHLAIKDRELAAAKQEIDRLSAENAALRAKAGA